MIFLSELVGTLLKAMDVTGMESSPACEAIPKLMNPRLSPDETFQGILASYYDLCVQIKHNYRDSTSILIKNVTEYIEAFYMDSSLSLCLLASKFNLSEPYLSHVFKERTGENLSNCLERIRINYAHALLSETTMSIDDIAEKVGYNSSDTFRKAFKRFHGISPAMYRSSTKSA
jgi:YesN/AraC family two-component response regulator